MNCFPPSFLSSPFLSVFSILLFLSTPSDSYLHSSCTGAEASSGFVQNLELAINSLSNEPITHGFTNLTVGDYPDQASLLLQCRGDINSTDTCEKCAANFGSKLHHICPNDSQGVVWTDDCLLHFFNGEISGKVDYDNKGCICNATKNAQPQALGSFLLSFLSNLTSSTIASNPRFARAGVGIPGTSQKLSGLAQCTGDVETSECKACLQDAMESINSCCEGKTSGLFLLGSCYMSFSIFNFTFKSSPVIPAATSLAPTPTPAPQERSKGGWAALSETSKAAILSATENVGIVALIGTGFWLYSSSRGGGGIVGRISRGASSLAGYRPSNPFGSKEEMQNRVNKGASGLLGVGPFNLFGGNPQAGGESKKEGEGNDKLADRLDDENPPTGKGTTTTGLGYQKSQHVAGSSLNSNQERQLNRAVALRAEQSSVQAESLSIVPLEISGQQGKMVVSQSTTDDVTWTGKNAIISSPKTDAPQALEKETAVHVAMLERELRDSVVAHARLEGSLHTSRTTLEWMMNVFGAWLRLAPPPPIPCSQTLIGQTSLASEGSHSTTIHPHAALCPPTNGVVVHGRHDHETLGAPTSHRHDKDLDDAVGTALPSEIGSTLLEHSNLADAPEPGTVTPGIPETAALDQTSTSISPIGSAARSNTKVAEIETHDAQHDEKDKKEFGGRSG
ncbi:cysteine-rich receptor-like protein kinase 15 [Nymphaea colorata]|nr:cysteine-rich receptor-like protein kinase 15 [Nymphaea colorata]